MYNLENYRSFCVDIVIECLLASGEIELGGEVGKCMGVSGRGATLIASRE